MTGPNRVSPPDEDPWNLWSFGAPDALLWRDGRWTRFRSIELPLGIVSPEEKFTPYEMEIPPDGELFLFTNGMIESTCMDGGMFGIGRPMESLEANGMDVEAVLQQVRSCADPRSFQDDMTIIRISSVDGREGAR